VTVLFADVVGSTELGERHDPEHYRRVLARAFDAVRATVEAHGGVVEKFIGDAVMAIFGVPAAHEDDALRAVRAATEIQRDAADRAAAAASDAVVLRWRIGINTGEVLAGGAGEHTFATGDTINLAARLEQAAGPGEIVVGATTHELVREAVIAEPLPSLRLKGKAAPVTAHRVALVDPDSRGRGRRFDQPFVGREEELELLSWVRRRALGRGAVQLVTVHGSPGVGKTRLVTEAVADVEVPVLWGRCLPYGDGVTWWPLVEAVVAATGLRRGDPAARVRAALSELAGGRVDASAVPAVAGTLGLTDDPVAADPTGVLRDYLLAVAGGRGVVLVVDDLQDAEPPLLDLLTAVVRPRPVPLLVLTTARPELLEHHPGWGGGGNVLSVTLEPLGPAETAALLDDRLPGGVAPDVGRRLAQVTEGNPLYLEELLARLLEDGGLRRDASGRWTLRSPDVLFALPTSIHGLLTARLDTLPAEDRRLLGAAAVVGLSFSLAAVNALADSDGAAAAARFEVLVDRQLVRHRDRGFGFRDQFVRDAVYAGLPRRMRAELHERYAWWLDGQAGSPQRDEFVAHHLERAVSERTALDPGDAELARLSAAAGERLEVAGRRAFSRLDVRAAARLLERALELRRPAGRERTELLVVLARARAECGDFRAAVDHLDDALAAAEQVGDRALHTSTRLTALWIGANLELAGWVEEASDAADDAIELFTQMGDDAGLGRAWGLRSEIHFLRAEYDAVEEAMHRAAGHAAAAGDDVEVREDSLGATVALVPGPTTVPTAIATVQALRERFADDRTAQCRLQLVLAPLRAMAGDHAAAGEAVEAAVEGLAALGQRWWGAVAASVEGRVARLAGDLEAAEAAFRRSVEELEQMGDRSMAAVVAADLAVTLGGDRVDEVARWVAYAAENAHRDDVDARARTLLAEAHLATCRGELDAGLAALDRAAALLAPTDALPMIADVHLARAHLLATAARADEARAAALTARDAYRRKGHVVGVGWAEQTSTASPSEAVGS
jgi:class 3 adenylate cyclase/predicted ATPase